jgi:ATP synthase protein I
VEKKTKEREREKRRQRAREQSTAGDTRDLRKLEIESFRTYKAPRYVLFYNYFTRARSHIFESVLLERMTTTTTTMRRCESSFASSSSSSSSSNAKNASSRAAALLSRKGGVQRRRRSDAFDFVPSSSASADENRITNAASSSSTQKVSKTSSSSSGGKSAYRPVWENDIDAEFRRKERFEKEKQKEREKVAASGLGFGRVNMLDDMSVDVGAQVKEIERRKKEEAEAKKTRGKKLNALDLATTDKGDSKYNLDGWNYAPTKAERSRWANEWAKAERAKAAKNPSYRPMSRQMLNRTIKDSDWKMRNEADKKAQETPTELQMRRRKEDQMRLEQSKRDLFTGTFGLCVAGGVGATFAGSSSSVLASWVLGSFGSLLYVRLLSQKADSQGGQGGPPTILVPVVLFLALNRYNALGGTDLTGLTLSPIPMLLAFFSYKPASLFQGIRDLVEEENEKTYSEQ